VLKKAGEDQLDRSVRNEKVGHRDKEEMNIPHTVK
jgi:hypothetical protein